MSAPGGQPPNMTPQQIYQQQLMRQQQQQQHMAMQRQQHMQQMQQQQQQQQNSPAFQRARTPQQMQSGGSPAAAHLQMHPHLQAHQPRSPLVQGGPGSVPQQQQQNPPTPQMMQQQMGMNQPMSLPPSHVSRPASVAPPASLPPNMHVAGPPSNQMDQMGSQMTPQQYPMHLQQGQSRPGSQQSQHVSGGSVGMPQGPQSVQQPASIQRPGSVLAPGSVQPPGSHGPQSHSVAGGPQSVQAFGPGSVQAPGSTQAPLSVQPASSFAPGSVQPPASQQPPASVQPPASAQSAAASNTKEPLKPNEEQIRMVQDPVDLVRNLVQKDLRSTIVEMNKRGGELIRQREAGEVTVHDREQYKRAANDFHAVCDEIERTLTTVMETAKQLSKLDKVFQDRSTKDLDGENMVNSVQNFVDNTDLVQKMFDGTIGSVTNTMEKIRRRQKKWEDQQKAKKAETSEDVEMNE